MKQPNYRATVSIGSGDDGAKFIDLCNEIAVKLNLQNVKGEPNFSALFKRGVESLAKELGIRQ